MRQDWPYWSRVAQQILRRDLWCYLAHKEMQHWNFLLEVHHGTWKMTTWKQKILHLKTMVPCQTSGVQETKAAKMFPCPSWTLRLIYIPIEKWVLNSPKSVHLISPKKLLVGVKNTNHHKMMRFHPHLPKLHVHCVPPFIFLSDIWSMKPFSLNHSDKWHFP